MTQTPANGPEPIRSLHAAADRVEMILQQRARDLARPVAVPAGDDLSLVAFTLGGERYGLALDNVREVRPAREVTPVPCTPDFVAGLINIRGAIYSVIDIRSFFGSAPQPPGASAQVIRVSAAGLDVGILADGLSGVLNVRRADLKPPPAALTGAPQEYVRGVTQDLLIVLNLEALLHDGRIVVCEEVD